MIYTIILILSLILSCGTYYLGHHNGKRKALMEFEECDDPDTVSIVDNKFTLNGIEYELIQDEPEDFYQFVNDVKKDKMN